MVLAANGQRIDNSPSLHNFEGLQDVGSRITLDVRREGKPMQVTATLKEGLRSVDGGTLDPRLQGAAFKELDEGSRQQLRSMGANGGLQVGTVTRGSRAWNSGLRPKDVVVAATSGNFSDLPSFRASFERKPPQLVLRILRGGRAADVLMQ